MPAKFITAPDKIPTNDRDTMLIVDAEWRDIESLGLLCMTRNIDMDFYLFGPTSIDVGWLNHAAEAADVILINNKSNRHIDIKENLNKNSKAKSLGAAADRHPTPLDYIVEQLGK